MAIDPRLELTAQDLTYAATGVRSLQRQAQADADNPQMQSCQALFESSARTYGELVSTPAPPFFRR